LTLPNGRHVVRFLAVVPDGVAKVRYFYSAPHARLQPGHVVRFDGSLTATVHDNVVALQSDRPTESLGWAVWYGSNGRVIHRDPTWSYLKRVGNHYVAKS
jgi:hypothetical protein